MPRFFVLLSQRDVEVEIETMDRVGTFLGSLLLPGGPKPVNMGLALLQARCRQSLVFRPCIVLLCYRSLACTSMEGGRGSLRHHASEGIVQSGSAVDY